MRKRQQRVAIQASIAAIRRASDAKGALAYRLDTSVKRLPFLAIEAKEWTLYSDRALKQSSQSARAQMLRRLDDESAGAPNVRINLYPVPSQRGLTVQPATGMIPLRHRHTAQHEPFSVCS